MSSRDVPWGHPCTRSSKNPQAFKLQDGRCDSKWHLPCIACQVGTMISGPGFVWRKCKQSPWKLRAQHIFFFAAVCTKLELNSSGNKWKSPCLSNVLNAFRENASAYVRAAWNYCSSAAKVSWLHLITYLEAVTYFEGWPLAVFATSKDFGHCFSVLVPQLGWPDA